MTQMTKQVFNLNNVAKERRLLAYEGSHLCQVFKP